MAMVLEAKKAVALVVKSTDVDVVKGEDMKVLVAAS